MDKKRIFALIAAAAMALSMLTACGDSDEDDDDDDTSISSREERKYLKSANADAKQVYTAAATVAAIQETSGYPVSDGIYRKDDGSEISEMISEKTDSHIGDWVVLFNQGAPVSAFCDLDDEPYAIGSYPTESEGLSDVKISKIEPTSKTAYISESGKYTDKNAPKSDESDGDEKDDAFSSYLSNNKLKTANANAKWTYTAAATVATKQETAGYPVSDGIYRKGDGGEISDMIDEYLGSDEDIDWVVYFKNGAPITAFACTEDKPYYIGSYPTPSLSKSVYDMIELYPDGQNSHIGEDGFYTAN